MCGTCKLKTLLAVKSRKPRLVKKSVAPFKKYTHVYIPGPLVDLTLIPRPRAVIMVD
jgi:hypothetical protein